MHADMIKGWRRQGKNGALGILFLMNEGGVLLLSPHVNWSAQWKILFAYASYLCYWIFLQLLWPSACVGDQGCSLSQIKVYTAGAAAQWQEWVILLVLCQHSCGIISQRRQMKHIAGKRPIHCWLFSYAQCCKGPSS